MEEKNIYEEGNLFVIKKEINGKMITFGSFETLDEAISERDELEEYGWPYLPEEPEELLSEEDYGQYISKRDGKFIVSRIIRGKEKVFGEFLSLDLAKEYKYKLIENAWDDSFRTKNIGPYGKFISKEGKRFVISRSIKGKLTRFGSYLTLDEAIIAREKLIEDNWGVDGEISLFKKGEYGKYITFSHGTYRINKSFDGTLYNFGKFDTLEDAKLARDILINNNWNQFKVPDELYSWRFFTLYSAPMQAYEVINLIDDDFISFGFFKTIKNAKLAIKILIENNWNSSKVPLYLYSKNSNIRFHYIRGKYESFSVVRRINGEMIYYSTFDTFEEAINERNKLLLSNWAEEELFEEKFDEYIYLGIDDKYYLKNYVNGDMKVFGVFDNYVDAVNARLECIKNNWGLNDLDEEEKPEEIFNDLDEEEKYEDLSQFEDIINIYNSIKTFKEEPKTLPQANDFYKLLNICEELYIGTMKKDDLLNYFDLNDHQYECYLSAGEYLGLIKEYSLSLKGIIIIKKDHEEEYLSIIKSIFEHKPFYDTFSLFLRKNSIPTNEDIYLLLKNNNYYDDISFETLMGYADTIKSWINWIVS